MSHHAASLRTGASRSCRSELIDLTIQPDDVGFLDDEEIELVESNGPEDEAQGPQQQQQQQQPQPRQKRQRDGKQKATLATQKLSVMELQARHCLHELSAVSIRCQHAAGA